jgi:hypothetical protein
MRGTAAAAWGAYCSAAAVGDHGTVDAGCTSTITPRHARLPYERRGRRPRRVREGRQHRSRRQHPPARQLPRLGPLQVRRGPAKPGQPGCRLLRRQAVGGVLLQQVVALLQHELLVLLHLRLVLLHLLLLAVLQLLHLLLVLQVQLLLLLVVGRGEQAGGGGARGGRQRRRRREHRRGRRCRRELHAVEQQRAVHQVAARQEAEELAPPAAPLGPPLLQAHRLGQHGAERQVEVVWPAHLKASTRPGGVQRAQPALAQPAPGGRVVLALALGRLAAGKVCRAGGGGLAGQGGRGEAPPCSAAGALG